MQTNVYYWQVHGYLVRAERDEEQRTGWEEKITKGHRKVFLADGYRHYLDCFTHTHIYICSTDICVYIKEDHYTHRK